MGKLLEAVARFRMKEKLKRGRCANCKVILPDDEVDGVCSDYCATEVMESRQW
jgi:hypothetical protein